MCLPGCQSTLTTYTCTSDESCQSSDLSGRCETSQYCSFSDSLCPSGQRYDEFAGAQSNVCVENAPVPDAGTFDAGECDWGVGFDILNIGPCLPTGVTDPGIYLVAGGDPGYVLDTTTGELSLDGAVEATIGTVVVQSDGSELFVVATEEFYISVDTTLVVTGSRPLAIVATGLVQIEGWLSVSGQGAISGPSASCDGGDGQEFQASGGGGGGGGFATPGGNCGIPDLGVEVQALGGVIAEDDDLVPLRGGCRGGNGHGSLGDSGGAGGAIELVSGTIIKLPGVIRADGGGGGGGAGAGENGGGGGGGSGGAILLQAPTIQYDQGGFSVVGGGGGGGGGFTHGEGGTTIRGGIGGTALDPGIGAGGGGGDGAEYDDAGNPGSNTITAELPAGGAGGGGGGTGHIRVVTGGGD